MTLTLSDLLMEYNRGNPEFAFVMQGGNQGDKMIYFGADKLAHSLGIRYSTHCCFQPYKNLTPTIPKFGRDIIIYMHGGGGFNRWWGWSPRLIKALRINNPTNTIILGPSTFDIDKEYLENLPSDVIYFARERTSYEFLQSMFPYVYLDHDTSLHLKLGDSYLSIILNNKKPRGGYNLLAVRGDAENGKFPESINKDDFKIKVDPCTAQDWAGLHLDASMIVTNRCHSAILGSLLGKKTILFAGSYHKNKSIWEYSLKQRGVEFIEN